MPNSLVAENSQFLNAMIIFLYGKDTYRSRQKLNEIIEHYKKSHKSGLNLKYFNGNDFSYQDFKGDFRLVPMFEEKKLAILTNVLPNQELKENFVLDSLKFINSKNTALFYEEGGVLSGNPLFEFFKKKAKSQEFKPLDNQGLLGWIRGEFKRCSAKADQQVIEKLASFAGNDLWRLSNEIKKLVSYGANRPEVEISVKDVELLVKPKIETDIFRTIDAIAAKNKKQALNFLREHLEKGEPPLQILSMVSFQFRNLLIVKHGIEERKPYYVILKTSNLHPFVVKKSCELAKKFTMSELKKIYRKIFQADINIKTGKTEPVAALDMLIAEL